LHIPRNLLAKIIANYRNSADRIEDATGQAVGYTYFRGDENEARQAKRAQRTTKSWRIASKYREAARATIFQVSRMRPAHDASRPTAAARRKPTIKRRRNVPNSEVALSPMP
jgi:hypothetical protein